MKQSLGVTISGGMENEMIFPRRAASTSDDLKCPTAGLGLLLFGHLLVILPPQWSLSGPPPPNAPQRPPCILTLNAPPCLTEGWSQRKPSGNKSPQPMICKESKGIREQRPQSYRFQSIRNGKCIPPSCFLIH